MANINGSTSCESRFEGRPKLLQKLPLDQEVMKTLQAFNTWAFKREQPSDLALLRKFIARSMMKSEPLSFVLYWGKGPRNEMAEPDLQCLDYIAALSARIKSAYSRGAEFNLVLTDTHATLNGHSNFHIARYFTEVEQEASKRNFRTYLLSDLTDIAGDIVNLEKCQQPSEDVLQRLKGSAERWYRGDGDPIDGATKYYHMNMIERQAIEFSFSSSIFVTFNGSEQRDLFPESLPIFYMYSLRRGTSIKPWFLSQPLARSVTIASYPTN